MFDNKKLLITGGTGSFGNAVLNKFLTTTVKEIRIFSRDEKKQDDMRRVYNNPKIKFFLGDVRDPNSIQAAMTGVDYVFHAAALKQVPSCEFYPIQAVLTNILGTENVLNVAVQNKVKKVICLSTDKAVYPINAMGMSKGLMEKTFIAKARSLGDSATVICGTRYGNVMASRGSVIPLFINQIKEKRPITITDPEMTRFMMSLTDAVDLVLHAYEHGQNGEIFVQKSPAATIATLTNALKTVFKCPSHPIRVIGTRHGEKLFETLLTREEVVRSENLDNYFRIRPDQRDLNYEIYFEEGESIINKATEFTSHNATMLNEAKMVEMLYGLEEIQENLRQLGVK